MIRRIEEFIRETNMIEKGDVVCAGVSGGADSVCLLVLLDRIKDDFGFSLRAFHTDHRLRGDESDKDRLFVEQLCKDLRVPLKTFVHDVSRFAKENALGTEEAGRILRRQDADACLCDGCSRIALAHHKNDSAETLLFHLARGSSLSGLCAIRPVSGPVIHPLLAFTKEEILDYLMKEGISWRNDRTNEDMAYTRNFIRHRIIPMMEERINGNTVQHLAAAARDLAEADALLQKQTNVLIRKYVHTGPEGTVIDSALKNEEPWLVRSVLKKCMEEQVLSSKDLTRVHLESIRGLLFSDGGKRVSLPYGLYAVSGYGRIFLKKSCGSAADSPELPFVPETDQRWNNISVASECVSDPSAWILEKNRYTKCFDYDKISSGCVLRTRKEGDYLILDRYGHTKKLKDFFIDCKVERERRDSVLLLASGSLIHWVVGFRMGESAKVKEDTSRFLKITIQKDDESGDSDFGNDLE